MPITEITELNQLLNQSNGNDTLCVVDFSATWCGPCQKIAPYFKTLSQQYEEVEFFKVDVDEADEELTSEYDVSAIPLFVFVKNGQKIASVAGANQTELLKNIQRHA